MLAGIGAENLDLDRSSSNAQGHLAPGVARASVVLPVAGRPLKMNSVGVESDMVPYLRRAPAAERKRAPKKLGLPEGSPKR